MIEPLTQELIHRSSERLCAQFDGFEQVEIDEDMLYGIAYQDAMTITFYVSYSTWDGRFLYLDQVAGDRSQLESGLKLLARIAIELGCSRLTWQYFEDKPLVDFTPPPEVLTGWLTLHWSADEIKQFLGQSDSAVIPTANHEDIRAAFGTTLVGTNSSDFRLRLATVDDLGAISRLVQGLADYEKEPEAVNVTQDHYRCDGFASSQQPLFYCVLLDKLGPERDTSSCDTCGMAFCYIARKKTDGLFLYLEDLFIEEQHRGSGAGMMMMRALAKVSLSLNCSKMVWQALDWNTPALNFYRKLGAKVVDGLTTARFAQENLRAFGLEE